MGKVNDNIKISVGIASRSIVAGRVVNHLSGLQYPAPDKSVSAITTKKSFFRNIIPVLVLVLAIVYFLIFALAYFDTNGINSTRCAAPLKIDGNSSPSRLVVVVPGTGQGKPEWESFFNKFKQEPQSKDSAWLLYDHQIKPLSAGRADSYARKLASCIQEKNANYDSITLIGHSIGGMLVRRAYLIAAKAISDDNNYTWAGKTDRIILLASVNRGVNLSTPGEGGDLKRSNHSIIYAAMSVINTLLNYIPINFVLEDLIRGSNFIADTRIAWIRYFAEMRQKGQKNPHVAQFYGDDDSFINKVDNADIEAFGTIPSIISDATHGDLQRLEAKFTGDPESRWNIYKPHLFGEKTFPTPSLQGSNKRFLFVLRGIRDSADSDWVTFIKEYANSKYYPDDQNGEHSVITPEYGYFSAAEFVVPHNRFEIVKKLRDDYSEIIAKHPLATFDFIGHSNGTYALGHALMNTPEMKFQNVALVAPVLPSDFPWKDIIKTRVAKLRYDTALYDWPVGILCQFLKAIGFTDVGNSGLVKFVDEKSAPEHIKHVGWYNGGHSAALDNSENLKHLVEFAFTGKDTSSAEKMSPESGPMRAASRATPHLTRIVMLLLIYRLIVYFYAGATIVGKRILYAILVGYAVLVMLDSA